MKNGGEQSEVGANGILHNELYIGRLVWNRQRFLKDPDTGKRVARTNPPSESITKDVPELRIIDDEVWRAVQTRMYIESGSTGDDVSGFTIPTADRQWSQTREPHPQDPVQL